MQLHNAILQKIQILKYLTFLRTYFT